MGCSVKILLVIPTGSGIHERTSMAAAILSQRPDVDFVAVKGRPSDYSRNSAIQLFLGNKQYSHIFFLDSDTEPPLDVIDRMLELDEPLVTGLYPVLMQTGVKWAILNYVDEAYRFAAQVDDYCDAAGAGCLMIRRDLFDKIAWPWFLWVNREDGTQMGEDIHFFDKCCEAGYRTRVAKDVVCSHYKEIDLRQFMKGI